MEENIYEEFQPKMVDADEVHAILSALKAENAKLKAEKAAKEQPTTNGSAGGEPVPHHLHLVDGRIVNDHGGIGTHYSETLPDGTERVTRVKSHYPANEVHPTLAYA